MCWANSRERRFGLFCIYFSHALMAIGTIISLVFWCMTGDSFALGWLCAYLVLWAFGSMVGYVITSMMRYENKVSPALPAPKLYSDFGDKPSSEFSDLDTL